MSPDTLMDRPDLVIKVVLLQSNESEHLQGEVYLKTIIWSNTMVDVTAVAIKMLLNNSLLIK